MRFFEERKCKLCGKDFYCPTIAEGDFCYECRTNQEKAEIIALMRREKEKEVKRRLEEILLEMSNPSSRELVGEELRELIATEFFIKYNREPTTEELIELAEKWKNIIWKWKDERQEGDS